MRRQTAGTPEIKLEKTPENPITTAQNASAEESAGFKFADKEKTVLLEYSGKSEYVTVPPGVIKIAAGAFAKCKFKQKIKVISLPGGLISIGDNAFEGLTSLSSVSFESFGLFNIGNYAFKNCKNLMVLSIPRSVESIGVGAFIGCNKV